MKWKQHKGAAPSLIDLLGGHIEVVCCSIPETANQAGEVRVLAVMAPERLQKYPDVPTVKELGFDWVAVGWRGLAVPKDTPDEIVDRLYRTCDKIARSDDYRDFMGKRGYEIEIRGPDEFARFLVEQEKQWQPVIEAAGYAKQP